MQLLQLDPNEKKSCVATSPLLHWGLCKDALYVEQHNSLLVDHPQDDVKKMVIIYKNI